MKLQFLGAARTVTGSSILLDTGSEKVLIDCGLYQGSRELEERNYLGFEYAPSDIDFVLLTHAHMGHYAGLIHFGREAANTSTLPVWCTARMAQFLRGNAPWDQLIQLKNLELNEVIWAPSAPKRAQTIKPWKGLTIRMIPVPHRGERNEPAFVAHVAEALAEKLEMPVRQVHEMTSRAAGRLFGFPPEP